MEKRKHILKLKIYWNNTLTGRYIIFLNLCLEKLKKTRSLKNPKMHSSSKAKNTKANIKNSSSSSSDGRRETPKKSSRNKSPSSSSSEDNRKTSKKTSNTKTNRNRSPSSSSSVKEVKSRKIPTVKPSPKTVSSAKTKTVETPAKTSPRPVVTPAVLGFDEYVNIKTSMTDLRNSLPLDFSETPMTPDTIETRFGDVQANVVSLNILLQDEKKLAIPKSIRSTLQSLFVTSSRLSGHIKLTDVSVLSECPNLKELSLSRCHVLSNVDSLSSLTNLEDVDLSHCSAIESLDLSKSVNLQVLNLSRCTMLKDLTSLNGSSKLRVLNLSYCESLTTLPLQGVNNLEVLDVSHTDKLETAPATFHLRELNIHGSALDKNYRPRLVGTDSFKVGSWNFLASGLEIDGFLTRDGLSSVEWNTRKQIVLDILANMLEVNDVVVTQENDNFFWLLDKLQLIDPNIRGVWCCKTVPGKSEGGDFTASNARSFLIKRMYQSFKADGLVSEEDSKKATFLLGLKPKEFAPKSSELYNIVNKINLEQKRFPTFREKSEVYNSFSEMYGVGPDDTYVSDDGIGIYYDSKKASLKHLATGLSRTPDETPWSRYGMVNDVPVLWNKNGWVDATFQLRNERMVTVYGAHLPSGEDEAAEKDRYEIMKEMINTIKSEEKTPVVFAMDSNVSPEYEAGFKDITLMSSLYGLAGFEDSIEPGSFPCFKMRGPGSDQPKKIGELFVDQIDKILYNPRVMSVLAREHPLDEYGFQRLSRQAYDEVYAIRTNEALRAQNNETVRKGARDAVVSGIYREPGSAFLEIYPGPNSPSDHPPVSSEFLFVPTFQRSVPESKREITPEPKPVKKESSPESEAKKSMKTPKLQKRDNWNPETLRERLEEILEERDEASYKKAMKDDKILDRVMKSMYRKMGKDSGEVGGFMGFDNDDFVEYLIAGKLLPEPTPKNKRDITPEPEMKTKPKKTATPVQESSPEPETKTKSKPKVVTPEAKKKAEPSSESEPKIKKTVTPEPKTKPAKKEPSSESEAKTKRTVTPEAKAKSPKWSEEKIKSRMISTIRNHYTRARKELGLKEYSADEIDELLEKVNKKVTKLVDNMFAATKQKDFTTYENEDFTEWLTASKLLPNWTEETKKSKKWTEESLRNKLEEVFKVEDKAKYKKAIADEKSVKMLGKLTRQMVKDMSKEDYAGYTDDDFVEYLRAGELLPQGD